MIWGRLREEIEYLGNGDTCCDKRRMYANVIRRIRSMSSLRWKDACCYGYIKVIKEIIEIMEDEFLRQKVKLQRI